MKGSLIIGLLLFTGQGFSQTPFDGPYVRYSAGKVVVSSIYKDDDLLIPQTAAYDSRQAVTLRVMPEGRAGWAFTLKLRDTLVNEPVTYPATGKCLFMSDIEGEFANFRNLLLAAKVIDTAYRWTYGSGSLVIPGDLFDRGKDVVPELWLLYKLEDEAKQQGGHVQVILGNHDIMNLSGDHRYTDGKYFKDAWLLQTGIGQLFSSDTELGRWLRTKNVIGKCGQVLVMHGGLSPVIHSLGLTLEQLNATCRAGYGLPRAQLPGSLQPLFGKDALFWYRGYFMQPRAGSFLIDSTLSQYHCRWIVAGHTIVKWNIASYYDGKVIGVDVDEHKGVAVAALLKGSQWYVIDESGKQRPLIYDHKNELITDNDIL